jgi:hypothetical protein
MFGRRTTLSSKRVDVVAAVGSSESPAADFMKKFRPKFYGKNLLFKFHFVTMTFSGEPLWLSGRVWRKINENQKKRSRATFFYNDL